MPQDQPQPEFVDVPTDLSIHEIEEFEKGRIWAAMRAYIHIRTEASRTELKYAEDLGNIKQAQGKVQLGDELIDLPQILIDSLIEHREDIQDGRE